MFGKKVPPLSVLGVRNTWGPEIVSLLEAGETVQVIVPARIGEARMIGVIKQMPWWSPFTFEPGRHVLLVATDRAWVPVVRPERPTDPFVLGTRCDRTIKLAVSSIKRFDALDQPYTIDPLWTDHVRAANEAVDARGRPWELEDCGDWIRDDPKKTHGLVRSAFKFR